VLVSNQVTGRMLCLLDGNRCGAQLHIPDVADAGSAS
jgi:hypothetical protein